ncbi:unnamed protein product [Linum tenue]|uniref:Uncharacterized protein n=1 Tax=Linum tenue TaxID=586396 RepID=A0AAV0HR61_9ROSI|nr:unnamed protein product [Linum tenue]
MNANGSKVRRRIKVFCVLAMEGVWGVREEVEQLGVGEASIERSLALKKAIMTRSGILSPDPHFWFATELVVAAGGLAAASLQCRFVCDDSQRRERNN